MTVAGEILPARAVADIAGRASLAGPVPRRGLAAFDAAGGLVLVNAHFAPLMDLPPAALRQGMAFSDLLDLMRAGMEFADPAGRAFIAGQAALDRTQPYDTRRTRADGRVIEVSSDPLPDGGWTIALADVTLFAYVEDEAHRRVTFLDALLESIPHGICVYGPDKRVRMFNRAYQDVMAGAEISIGDHLEDVIARRLAGDEFGPPGQSDAYSQSEERDFSRRHVRPRRRRPNGTFVDVRSAPLPDGGHVSVVTDVTQLALAEAALAGHAAEMETMLTHSRHGVILWSAEQTLIASNSVVADVLDVPVEMLVRGVRGIDLLQFVKDYGAFGVGAEADAYFENQLAHDRSVPLTTQRVTANGKAVEVRSNPMPGGGYVVTYTDVTELRRAEQELRVAIDAAEEANAARARFLATMSHELRTPLNSVIGFSDTLMRDRGTTEPAQVREYAEDINAAGKRLLMLINNMLDVARIEAGRFDLGTDRIDIRRMVQSCLRQYRAPAGAAEIDLFEELPGTLPLVRGDERRMQQVLTNLLANAVKFTEPGGTVTVGAEVDEIGDLLISVTDTGIGIPQDQIANAFEPFTQIDSGLSRRFEGTGLGLYFSRALVQAHGGVLSLRSLVGVGTTAEIRIPGRRLDGAV